MTYTISLDDYLDSIGVIKHYGTPRHSGRYPWGSGEEGAGSTRNPSFLDTVSSMRKEGMTDTEIAKSMNMKRNQLQAAKAIAKNELKQSQITMANKLKDKGYSNGAIAERMGLAGESSVRALLADGALDKVNVLNATSDALKRRVDEGVYLDIGTGSEHQVSAAQAMKITRNKLDTAVAALVEQGYEVHKVQVDQLGTKNKTTMKVLCPPGTEYRDVVQNRDKIGQIKEFSEDGGRTYLGIKDPLSISSKRVGINFAEDGGTLADGVIYVRPGVKDVSIGNNRYAQVRIKVDGTHYLKGMAVYKDDLPDGVDLVFNTNKERAVGKLGAMKPLKDDIDNPFGAVINQMIDPKTGKVTSAMNLVGNKEGAGGEGTWDTWSRNLPSQFLSKQSPLLAKQQLELTQLRKKDELDDIMKLTNPVVRKKLLESYADSTDSSAVHLKAAAMPRQSTHVILPINSLKPTEVYAPNFKHGERLVLVRFPHGGTFEIPEVVNNKRNKEAVKTLGSAKDAIGIHSKVAERLSGADFDGDTVLVIPNGSGRVKTTTALEKLKNFDAKAQYKEFPGMRRMTPRETGIEMGMISNLITDMTIKGASADELARAVKHSMVVIDAEKHKLNYKQSEIDNNIKDLKVRYQGKSTGGASTLISRATSEQRVRDRQLRRASEGGHIDPKTGKLLYTERGKEWTDAKGKVHTPKLKSTKLAETDDARSLLSANGGTKIERIYADHSNTLKSLANQARLYSLDTPNTKYSPSAKKAFAPEVKTLDAKLTLAVQNRPLERQAQVYANAIVRQKKAANPEMSGDELKRIKSQALTAARLRTGANKEQIHITDNEWNAIQAGAISSSKLRDILTNADIERVKELATPKQTTLMTSTKRSRAEAMMRLGYDQADVAEALGVSVTTLKRSLEG